MQTGVRQFLLACLRTRIRPVERDALLDAALASAPPWDDVLRVAETERVAPLLHDVLRHRPDVDAEILQVLARSFHRTSLRNMLAFRALGEVLGALTRAGVPVVVLKGAALAETVYRNIGLRPMYDVDLLVRESDIDPALGVLAACNCAPAEPRAVDGFRAGQQHGLVLRRAAGPGVLELELHRTLIDAPSHRRVLALQWFWDHTVPATIGGAPALSLAPEAQLLHLCAHARLHHYGDELLWLHDVAELLTAARDRIAWNVVLRQARACHLVSAVRDVVMDVGREWQAPIPTNVLRELSTLRPSLTSSARYAWARVFPSFPYMQQRFGVPRRWLLPFYYPYRWLVGVRGTIGRRDLGDPEQL